MQLGRLEELRPLRIALNDPYIAQYDQVNETSRPRQPSHSLSCTRCFFIAGSRAVFTSHFREKHWLSCTKPHRNGKLKTCGARFPTLEKLIQHEQNQHDVKCPHCDKIFSSKRNLRKHIIWHTRPHACDRCPSKFATLSALKIHLRTQHQVLSGKKLHSCRECSRSFVDHRNFARHLTTHLKEQGYVCSICSKSLTRGSSLREHMRTHKPLEQHSCKLCSAKYSWRTSLKRHLRSKHCEVPTRSI